MTAGSATKPAWSRIIKLLQLQLRSSPPSPPNPPPNPRSPTPPSSPAPPTPKSLSTLTSYVRSSLDSAYAQLPSLSFLSLLPKLESLSRQSIEREVLSQTCPYDDLVARVERRGRTLGKEEMEYMEGRRQRVLPHLRRLAEPRSLGPPTPSPPPLSASSAPTVAVCLSGGGYRAMLGSISALSTLNGLGILPATSYVSGLSGSTWAMSQLYSLPDPPTHPMNFAPILERVREQVALPLLSRHSPTLEALMPVIKRSIVDRFNSQQSLTLTDVLSWFISHRILSSIPPPPSTSPASFLSSLTLSGQRASLASASLPFPLYTAITAPEQIQFEFSPYSVGSWELAAFIPTWAFNRPFKGGASTSSVPREPHLSTLLSVFSSAHCTDLATQLSELATQMKAGERVKEGVKEVVERMKREWKLHDVRPFEAIAFNSFMHRLPPSPTFPFAPSLTSEASISLMDAGLSFNFPLVPLVQPHRAVDVIVLVDFTSPPEAINGVFLHSAQRYCRAHGLPLPEWTDGVQPLGSLQVKREESVKRSEIREGEGLQKGGPTKDPKGKESGEVEALYRASHSRVTVFPGRGEVPTIVYIPLLSNAAFDRDFCPRKSFEMGGFCATLNFVYTKAESNQLMGLVQANIEECEEVIRQQIALKWREKEERPPPSNTH